MTDRSSTPGGKARAARAALLDMLSVCGLVVLGVGLAALAFEAAKVLSAWEYFTIFGLTVFVGGWYVFYRLHRRHQ